MQRILQKDEQQGSDERLVYIRAQLRALADPAYANFQSALLRKPGEDILTGSAARYLGVRLPDLRKFSRQLAKENWQANLDALKTANRSGIVSDSFYEELMLEGMLIGLAAKQLVPQNRKSGAGCLDTSQKQRLTLEEQFALIADFVPLIDNWGLCDSFCTGLKFVEECRQQCWEFLQPFLCSDKEYEIRFGVVMLLVYFIKEDYIDRLYPVFDAIRHDGYYVKMAVAWAVSICYVKFPDKSLSYLKTCSLDDFTYRKALQKITESRCVSAEEKTMIRGMKPRER